MPEAELASDPVYVVAGAVRIQQWIARTPDLALSRGASGALAERTDSQHIGHGLSLSKIPAELAPDAPEVDGVVALRVTSGSQDDVDLTVDWLGRYLAEQLPGVEWKLWAHRASNYVAAFDAASRETQVGTGIKEQVRRWHLPPAPLDLVMATSCGGCRQETALIPRELPGKESRLLGLDCLARHDHTKGQTDQRAWTFDKLARLGGVSPETDKQPQTIGRRAADNHLATIAADGNRVGALFKCLAKIPAVSIDGRTTIHQEISKGLHDAAKDAVDAASQVGDRSAPFRCSIEHVVGGDDILVSVGARFAWQYVQELLSKFDTVFQAKVSKAIDDAVAAKALEETMAGELRLLTEQVSLGVGMAFANRTYPFAHCTEMAQQALSEAKRQGTGDAAVCWLDLTVESKVPSGRWLSQEQLMTPPAVSGLTPSARATLAALIREGRLASPVPESQAEVEQQASDIGEDVRAWSRRTENEAALELPETFDEAALRRLERDLDQARWWPALNSNKPGER